MPKTIPDLKQELSGKESIKKELRKLHGRVKKGFEDQKDRALEISGYWDIYNCKLGDKQTYISSTQSYIPLVRNAIEARTTRFVNQMFPQNGRYVEVVSESGEIPYAHTAILEHYVRKMKLRQVMPALCVNGDVEGQYSIYLSEKKLKRHMLKKKTRGVSVRGVEVHELDEYEDIEEELEDTWEPHLEILHDSDIVILPVTADCVDEALNIGGCVALIRRFSKDQLDAMVSDGLLKKDAVDEIKESMSKLEGNDAVKSPVKQLAKDAGVKTEGGKKFCEVYEVWTKLDLGKDEGERTCVTWFAGTELILGCKRNPYWCDKIPVISAPVEKLAGLAKGTSKCKAVAPLQYIANDALNEAMDASRFSLMPIIMTDPEKNPRYQSMVFDVGAVWATNPNDTQVMTFPQLWGPAAAIIESLKSEIFQTLSVNPSMIPNQTGGKQKKLSQAEVANEQHVDMLTTADAVTNIEEGILNQLVERLYEYDYQYRTKEISVRKYGELGMRSSMERVEPFQFEDRYVFRWFGVEAARSAQQIQQQISAINVIRGIPPELYKGHTIDMTPAIENLMENAFGPRLAPRIFKDKNADSSFDAMLENQMIEDGFPVQIHASDDDKQHIQKHIEGMKDLEDEEASPLFMMHIKEHMEQFEQKEKLQLMQKMGMMGGGQPGQPQGQGGAMPQPGGAPGAPTNMKQPPGAMHPDRMKDPSMMPRKM